jgi:single-strand DNA-binding protein
MASLNKTTLIGNLGVDPVVRFRPNGTPVVTVSLATTNKWKDKATGQIKEQTEWHRIVFFNKLAETVGEYLKKGSQVYVEGQLKTRKWTDNKNIDRYTTEIFARELQMLGKKEAANVPSAPSVDEPPLPDNFADDTEE